MLPSGHAFVKIRVDGSGCDDIVVIILIVIAWDARAGHCIAARTSGSFGTFRSFGSHGSCGTVLTRATARGNLSFYPGPEAIIIDFQLGR